MFENGLMDIGLCVEEALELLEIEVGLRACVAFFQLSSTRDLG